MRSTATLRNEGIDSSHHPEFTMLELYQAYGDHNSMAALLRDVIQEAASTVFGSPVVTHAGGTEFDLGGQWRSVTRFGTLSVAFGGQVSVGTPHVQRVSYARKHD